MATSKSNRMTPSQMRERLESLEKENAKLKESVYCYMCDEHKARYQFYSSSDPMISSGVTPICKKCAYDIAMRKDKNGDYHEPTKDSIQTALYYLNKPFIEKVYASAVQSGAPQNTGETSRVWAEYGRMISSLPQYTGLTYKDSDMFKEHIIYEDEKTAETVIKGKEDQDVYSSFVKNKNDVLRLLNYDPFEKEAISDQPFLYSQLLGLLDANEEANDDMMRTASCISIVRGFLQQSKIDNKIADIMNDPIQFAKQSATLKLLQDSKKAVSGVITSLAKESCISLLNSKNAKKGENTWTGKIKKIKDMNLREGEVNGFDIGTCRGMRQVMDMSNASILKQLRLDESEYSDMLAEQREMITKLQSDLEAYKEISRILLRENIDLKDYLEENDLLDKHSLVNLDELYSCFSDVGENNEEIEPGGEANG